MTEIHHGGRTINTADDDEAADLIAQARVIAETGHSVAVMIEAKAGEGSDAIVFGPGIPISATVQNVELFTRLVQKRVDSSTTEGIP